MELCSSPGWQLMLCGHLHIESYDMCDYLAYCFWGKLESCPMESLSLEKNSNMSAFRWFYYVWHNPPVQLGKMVIEAYVSVGYHHCVVRRLIVED